MWAEEVDISAFTASKGQYHMEIKLNTDDTDTVTDVVICTFDYTAVAASDDGTCVENYTQTSPSRTFLVSPSIVSQTVYYDTVNKLGYYGIKI